MAIQTLNTIKNWFKTTLKPSQQQFWDTWDSFRHKLDKVPVKDVEGIDELLYTKADKNVLNDHITDVNAHASLLELKEDKSQKGIAHGYAPLNSFTKLASQYLDIVNDLVSGGSSSLLSAEQGVILQNQIKNINATLTSDNLDLNTFQEIVDAIESIQSSLSTILVNDLTTGGSMKALTAEMGKILNENKENKSQRGIANGYAPLDNFAKISNTYLNIVNDLITGGTDSLLSAEQGKILKEKIDGIDSLIDNKIDTAEFEYHLSDPNAHSDLLHEKEDKANKNKADGYVGLDGISKISTGFLSMVNDLTTGGDNPLTAEQGKILKGLIDDHTGGDFQATLIAGSEATIDKKFTVRSQNDEIGATSFLTVNSESSQVDGIAGIGMFTNKRLDMAGEHVVLQSYMGYGSLSLQDSGVVLHGNSTSLTLNGGAGGLTLQGGSVATKIATGGLGVTVDGKNIIRSINGLEADTSGNVDISAGGSQNLQQTLENGSTATVNSDIYIQSTGFGGATSSINFVPAGTMPTTTGLSLYTDNALDMYGLGFNLASTLGQGKISSVGNSQLVVNSESGKLFLKGGALGVDLDGQGGEVNINSPYAIKINSKNAITSINGTEADEFGAITISGGSQDLQSVFNNRTGGKVYASVPENQSGAYFEENIYDSGFYDIYSKNGPLNTNFNMDPSNLILSLGDNTNGTNSRINVTLSGITDNNTRSDYYFKQKDATGNYYVATEDQIALQGLIENDKNSASVDGGDAAILTGADWDKSTYFVSKGEDGNQEASLNIDKTAIELHGRDYSAGNDDFRSGSYFISNGKLVYEQISFNGASRVQFASPIATGDGATFIIPAKNMGTYTLATTKDLPNMVTAAAAPTSATDTGTAGEIRINANYIYMCIATDTWKRSPLSTW